jgi:hypothetical protein
MATNKGFSQTPTRVLLWNLKSHKHRNKPYIGLYSKVVIHFQSSCRSRSHITTDGQYVKVSSPLWDLWPDITFCPKVVFWKLLCVLYLCIVLLNKFLTWQRLLTHLGFEPHTWHHCCISSGDYGLADRASGPSGANTEYYSIIITDGLQVQSVPVFIFFK